MIKSAAELLKAGSLRTADITVCGAKIRVREMSVAAWRKVAQLDNRAGSAVMVQMCAIDPNGAPLFSEDQVGDIDSMLRPEMIDGITTEILKLSGVGGEEKKD